MAIIAWLRSFFVLQFLGEETVKIYTALVSFRARRLIVQKKCVRHSRRSGLVPSPKLQAPNDMSAATNHSHLSNFYTFTSYNIKCD